jgi:hypothetical protein
VAGQLLLQLSRDIVVGESKLRWLEEQRIRLVVSSEVFSTINLDRISPGAFSELYNQLIWDMAEQSQGGLAGNIRGIPSAMEQASKQASQPQPSGLPAL